MLASLLEDFRLLVSEGQSNSKFSKSESKLIVNVVNDYIESNNLEYADILPELRELERYHGINLCMNVSSPEILSLSHSTKRKRHVVWKELAELIPHRTQKVYRQPPRH